MDQVVVSGCNNIEETLKTYFYLNYIIGIYVGGKKLYKRESDSRRRILPLVFRRGFEDRNVAFVSQWRQD